MIRISYILPCYNIERYILDCLNSIYHQVLKEEEFEVICVNDCSPDKTRDIIVEFQKNHSNLILIDHEKNKRVGAARNTGFYVAKGEYVWFIDPDDIIHQYAAKDLLPLLDDHQLDFVQFGHTWMTEDKALIKNPPFDLNCPFNTDVISGIDFLHEYQKRNLLYADMHSGPFVRIYRRSFLVNNNILYPEVAYYEDQYHALHGLIAAKRIIIVGKSYYLYRVVDSSYSHVPMSVQKRASQVNMCMGMIRLMQQYEITQKDIEYVAVRYDQDLKYFNTHFVLLMPDHERKLFLDLIKDDLPQLRERIPKVGWLMANYPNIFNSIACLIAPSIRAIKRYVRRQS